MVTRGKRWIIAALVAAVGAWTAPMGALAASTALRSSTDHGKVSQGEPKDKDHHKHKKDEKPPQLDPKEKDHHKHKKDEKPPKLDHKKKDKKKDEKPPQSFAAKEPKKDCKDKKKDGALLA
jgi:hypothetical protein